LAVRIEIVSSAPREKARLAAIRDVFLRGTLERRTSSRREPFRFFRKSRLTTDVDPMGFAALVRRDAALHSNERHTESCDDDEVSPSS
jgi:hypothetical protein